MYSVRRTSHEVAASKTRQFRERPKSSRDYEDVMEIVAKPEMWVGLDTNATAGGNGNGVNKWNSNFGVALLA